MVVQNQVREDFFDEFSFSIGIGRHCQLSETRRDWAFDQNPFAVAEVLEALVAAVPSTAALSNASKALVVTQSLNDAIVGRV